MQILNRVRARMGDFWWYSLLLFCAARAADLLNAFVGLWLVPKYVDTAELGAVMPLINFAGFFAIPVAVFANTFRNEVSRLVVANEFGRLKTLMKGVFVATAVFLVIAILASRILLPMFLERIRIVEGSLGFLILASAFVGAAHPVFSNALQALKKFNSCVVIGIIGAPVRIVAMLIAMPFRALSGYFVGQTATPAFNIIASVICLKKELGVKAEPYWTRDVARRFARMFMIFAAMAFAGGVYGLVEATIIRQRLPDLDSAGYYMATRFSEIAGFMTGTLTFTIFPYAADLAAAGRKAHSLLFKSALAIACFGAVIALPFTFFGDRILALLPHGDEYCAYSWAIPWLIGIGVVSSFTALFTTVEISANRFGFLKWMIPLDLGYPAALLLVTGYGYFTGFIPASWTEFLKAHNILSLGSMLCWMTAINLVKALACLVAIIRQRSR